MPAWYWIFLGIALAIAEIVFPGAVLLWLGVAAFTVGLITMAVPDLSWQAQLATLVPLSAVSLATGLYVRRRLAGPARTSAVNQGTQRFIGQRGTLDNGIVNGRGEVRLGDTLWPVTGPDLAAGTAVIVTGSDGVTLSVSPLAQEHAASAGAAHEP